MGLSKRQIEEMQRLLTPQQKRFSIMDVVQKFPDNGHIHDTFRQICLHYQASTLSFKQIMEYLFSQFNSNATQNIQMQTNEHQGIKSKEYGQLLKVRKNNTEEDFKVVLLGAQTQRINEIVLVSEDGQGHENNSKRDQVYVITNTIVRQFDVASQQFGKQVINLQQKHNQRAIKQSKLQNNPTLSQNETRSRVIDLTKSTQIIKKCAIIGNIVGYINKEHEFYLQVIPQKLRQSELNSQKKNGKVKHKQQQMAQVSQVLITKLPKSLDIIQLIAFSQQQWLVCSSNNIISFFLDLSTISNQFKYTKKKTQFSALTKSTSLLIHKICVLVYPYIAALTNQQSIIIVNTSKMSIAHTMNNDVNFIGLAYNLQYNRIALSDFGGWLFSLTFNTTHGDIEEQGSNSGIYDLELKNNINNSNNQMMQTYYIDVNHKKIKVSNNEYANVPKLNDRNNKNLDQIVANKETHTKYTTIIQNNMRNPLQMLDTKQKSIFSYQSKYQRIIKIWDIKTLQNYQKIRLNLQIYSMKVSHYGLYILSRQKGYLCYYAIDQTYRNNTNNDAQMDIVNVTIDSNVMFINAVNLGRSVVYKLKLMNKPKLLQYCSNFSQNPEKTLRYACYKNQVCMLNLNKTSNNINQLQLYGVFGEIKQNQMNYESKGNKNTSIDAKQYYQMIAYSQKKGIILWNGKKVSIRYKRQKIPSILHKKYSKGQHIFSNYYQNQYSHAGNDQIYSQSIVLGQQQSILKIKCFQNYLTIICKPKTTLSQNMTKQSVTLLENASNASVMSNNSRNTMKNSHKFEQLCNCYVIDENTMSLIMLFTLNQKYRILQSHRNCTLIMHEFQSTPKSTHTKQYLLFSNKQSKYIWKSQDIQGWNLEFVNIISINNSQVELLCTYKSNSIDLQTSHQKQDKNLNKNRLKSSCGQKPMFYLIKTTIPLRLEERKFINMATNSNHYRLESQNLTEIVQRSIYDKYTCSQIQNAKSDYQAYKKATYKVFFPYQTIQQDINKYAEEDLKTKQQNTYMQQLKYLNGKVVYYSEQQNIIMFAIYGQKLTILYQIQTKNIAQCIGIIDFTKLQTSNELKKCIRFWNDNYKKQEEQLWEQAKNKAIRRVKNNRTPEPLTFLRSDSLRNTNKAWNPEILQQNIVIALAQKNTKSCKTIKKDAQKVNQLFHRYNIHQSIQEQSTKNRGSQKKRKKKQPQINDDKIQALTSVVRKTKQSLFNQTIAFSVNSKTTSSIDLSRKLKTEHSTLSKNQVMPVVIQRQKKQRYQTEALEQLQKSKIIEKILLPKLETTRNDSLKLENKKKALIYDLLKRQQQSLQQSRHAQVKTQQL